MVGAITGDLAAPAGSEVLLLVNGFGGTPSMELYLMYDAARRILDAQGLKVARSLVGSYCTSLDMAGCSLTSPPSTTSCPPVGRPGPYRGPALVSLVSRSNSPK